MANLYSNCGNGTARQRIDIIYPLIARNYSQLTAAAGKDCEIESKEAF